MTVNRTISVFLRYCAICALPICFAATGSMAQQSTQFTQYMFNGLVINPAYAGADEALSLTFIQRNQWADVENAPTTQTLSAHTLFKKKHIGLGVSLINDKIGVHKNLSALTSYAYHLKVGRDSYFSMGLQAGILNKQSDYASLVNPAINDPKLNNPFISHTSVNFGMGFYFRNPKLHLGLSVPELIPAKVSINDSTRIQLSTANYFLFFKYRLHINQTVDFEPGALLKYTAGLPLSFDLNASLIFHRVLTMGLSYRRSESIDFLLRGQLTPQLQFGYSYDYPLGEITKLSSGSHELMVNYVFRYVRNKVSSPR